MTKTRIIEALRREKTLIDAHTHVGVSYDNYLDGAYPYALSFEDLAIRMKILGVGRSVVFPLGSSYFARARFGDSPEFSRFPYEKENRNLFREVYDIFPEYAEMALPFVMFDPTYCGQEQADALEAIAADYPVFGLKTVTSYTRTFVKDIETKGRPILEFARRHDLPILFHSAYHPDDIWASVYDIIAIAERNPDVRFCVAHSARFVTSVLDRAAAAPNAFVDLSAFKIHCDLAMSGSLSIPAENDGRFPSDYRSPETVMRDMVKAYPDTLVWGTDTPAYYFIQKFQGASGKVNDVRLTCPYDREMAILKSLPTDAVERITYRNTLRFLFG